MKNIINVLTARGFIDAMTSDEIRVLCDRPLKVYIGFDPTSDSLHLGNMIAIMGLAWFQRLGHTPVTIVGGATGMIGDPSGKSTERNLLNESTIEKNVRGIKRSLESILNFETGREKALILNNYDWFKNYGYINFLRDIGKHFRMGTMLSKESVRTRLSTEEGMSYTEFSYQLLQAYDFLYLFDHHGVTLQMGGSDQWGNITAGTELVRKMRGETVHGLTFPLLTRSDGKKFGKSEEGAIWLNPDKLPSYDFYQYLFRIPDTDISKMFRMLTFLELKEIEEIENSMKQSSYAPNSAQRRLAEEVTKIVHGEKGLQEALKITQAASPGAKTYLDANLLATMAKDLPSCKITAAEIVGMKLIDLYVHCGFQSSKGEAKRLILGGGAYVNNEKIEDENFMIQKKDIIEGRYILLSIGKKKKMVVEIL
jgi:tyrosyl-tRNA synthetase